MQSPTVSDLSAVLYVAQPGTGEMSKGSEVLAADRVVPLLTVVAVHVALIVWLNTVMVQSEPMLALPAPVMTGVLVAPPAPLPVVEPPRPLHIERPVVRPAPEPSLPIIQEESAPPSEIETPPAEQPVSLPETSSQVFTMPQVNEYKPEPMTPQVIPPRIDASQLNNPAPPYPPLSRRLGEQGRVLLDVNILPDGSVGEIKLKLSSGYPRLDKSALEAVKHWRYVPAKRGGEPIPYWYVQPIVFSLRN